jgi:hypothetical protein
MRRRKLLDDSRKWMDACRKLLAQRCEWPYATVMEAPPQEVAARIPERKLVDAMVCFAHELDPRIVTQIAQVAMDARVASVLVLSEMEIPTSGDWVWNLETLPTGDVREENGFLVPTGAGAKPIRFQEMGYFDKADMQNLVARLLQRRENRLN